MSFLFIAPVLAGVILQHSFTNFGHFCRCPCRCYLAGKMTSRSVLNLDRCSHRQVTGCFPRCLEPWDEHQYLHQWELRYFYFYVAFVAGHGHQYPHLRMAGYFLQYLVCGEEGLRYPHQRVEGCFQQCRVTEGGPENPLPDGP